eukprot:gene27269-51667_t
MAALPLVAAAAALSIVPPDTSLATANIAMLAKMRLVMIEKWEGHCWSKCHRDCLAKPDSSACQPGCAVEDDIVDTLRRVKAVNPAVAGVLYLNTLLAFPFYSLIGRYNNNINESKLADIAKELHENALAIDSTTKQPIKIRNDNGMEGIFVYGFDEEKGVQLYVDAVKNLTATGVPNRHGQWQICNHECGNVTEAQGKAWNAGKAKALAAATQYVGAGPYFANGDFFEGVESNLNGHWSTDADLKHGDPRDLIKDHWTTDPNDPASLVSACDANCLARFLLAVEKGAFLGTNGWDPAYELPLVYTAAVDGASPATLRRNFTSGTFVVFTYADASAAGARHPMRRLREHAPEPRTCGEHDVARSTTATAAACCEACGANTECAEWAWHSKGTECHQHSKDAVMKSQQGTTSGCVRTAAGAAVLLRTAARVASLQGAGRPQLTAHGAPPGPVRCRDARATVRPSTATSAVPS